MKVIDFALQTETDGKAYYEGLAAETPSKELTNLYSLLAETRQRHFDALMERKCERPFALVESALLDDAENVFAFLMRIKGDSPYRVDRDGYRHSVKAEEQSIAWYQKAAAKEQDPEVRRLLHALADEERVHLAITENIYDFVLTPRCYLAWREFSNLRGL